MKKSILFAAAIIVPVMMVITAVYNIGAPVLIRLFMDNDQIVAYGIRFLRALSLAMAFLSMDFIAVGVFQALGMGKNALIFAVLRKIVLEIPLLLLLNWVYPLYGLPYAQLGAEIVLCVVAVFIMRRILGDNNNLSKQ
jgi:Na+-driven multidrug efflux pump